MIIEISDHAMQAMAQDGLSEEVVRGDVHRVVTAYLVRGKKRWLVAR